MTFSKRGARLIMQASVLTALLTFGHALGATSCVDPAGANGCSTTISAAVAAAKAGDRINVGPGQYNEGVVITKSLSLVGSGTGNTIINARGKSNGIYVNGLDNGGIYTVLITGLTVTNANYEGILLTNTSYAVVSDNHVADNNQSLNYGTGCPGIPLFETNEGDDCGEGIHLVGVDHSTIANNVVELNAGGILLSDETGGTYGNLITGNSVHDNALDCGITLASHAPSPQAASKLPYGVFNNTISGNNSSRNGLVGAGAGIGIFAPGPGNLAFGNKVIGNIAIGNGLPGVTVHNHAAPPGAPQSNMNDITIVGNFLSGNAADDADAATPGTAGINIYGVFPSYGTVIAENTIVNEDIGVVMNNPGSMDVHMNNLGTAMGILNQGKGTINASLNYFGCPDGPGGSGKTCGTVKGPALISSPWLSSPVGSAPSAPGKSRP